MNTSSIYIAISIVALVIIFVILIIQRKRVREKGLSGLATFAFLFVIAGIVFGDDRIIGYSLMGIGVLLAVIDILKKKKDKSISKEDN
jgi:uncharacterized membrane protein YhaH (DUF805 family)